MQPFTFVQASDTERAVREGGAPEAAFVAGGTTIVDLMRLEVMRPTRLIDITALPLGDVEDAGGGVRIGALARNSDVAIHPLVTARFPMLAEALLSGASGQLRNMATTGGNLLQRTRCPYFRDPATPCHKREPGSGCAAMEGYTRSHAVLGTSERCIATNPSDMNVALVALDAIVHTRGPRGARTIPIGDFHTLPGLHPEIETVLGAGELVTHVELPAAGAAFAPSSTYAKVRDRASFSFALASAAVGLVIRGGSIADARIALGGVATKPWRSREAEGELIGHPPSPTLFAHAATVALAGAQPRPDNAFKVPLAQRTIVRALIAAAGGAS
jgi:xanthine dehydrogenase YagS FAD-binding subunit